MTYHTGKVELHNVFRNIMCHFEIRCGQLLTCQITLFPCAQVRVLQAFWARIVNRSKVPHLLRTLPRAAQILAGHKLGWRTVMSLHSPDASYVLDLRRPDDADVGAKLFRAGADIRGRCVNNLLVNGAHAALLLHDCFGVVCARRRPLVYA